MDAPRLSRQMSRFLMCLAVVVLVKVVWVFGSTVFWTWQHLAIVSGDTEIYFAVGRGLLNGLTLYRDVFDNKPPAILILAAASLLFTKSGLLYFLCAGAAVVGIPLVLFVWGWRQSRDIVILATLFGMGIALHAMHRGVFSQPQLFGVFFSVVFLVSITIRGRWAFLLSVLAAMGAIGMLEPFLLSLAASLLVIGSGRRGMIAILSALGVGAAIMAIMGWLWPYLTIYLPELLYGRMVNEATYHLTTGTTLSGESPLWLRALETRHLYSADAWESPVPLLIYCVMGILAVLPACHSRSRATGGVATLLSLSAVYLAHRIFLLAQVLIVARTSSVAIEITPLFALFWQDLLLAVATAGTCAWLFRKDLEALLWVGRLIAAFLLATLAVGSAGNYQAHHFLFATPLYVAGFMAVAGQIGKNDWPLLILSAAVGSAMLLSPSQYYLQKRELMAPDAHSVADTKTIAANMDSLMDSCRMDQYLPWQGHPWPMRHSPYVFWHAIARAFQPVFGNPPNSAFASAYVEALDRTRLVAVNSKVPIPGQVQTVIDSQFTVTAPSCAKEWVPKIPYELYFRE